MDSRSNDMNRTRAAEKTFAIALAAILLLGGCETVVDVAIPEHTPLLVANGFFTPDADWQIQLYRSRGILDNDPYEQITDATVQILEDDAVVATLSEVYPGLYGLYQGTGAQAGHTYTLHASAPGLEAIEATDSIPTPVQIQRVEVNFGANIENITVHFSDPPGIKNYYQIGILQEIQGIPGMTFPVYFETDDLIFESQGGIDEEEAFFDDSLISGQDYGLRLRIYPQEPIGELYVLLLSVSESYYRYMESTKDLDDNPFVEPMRAFSNIANGFGIFAGYSISAVRVL
jgi:hypothetical protein